MKLSRLALAIAVLPLSSLYAVADTVEDALKLSDSVITTNRVAEARSNSTAAITLFTREDIDRLQPVNVADLLNRVPGVQVAQSGGRGSVSGVFIRGTKTAQALVLVDGMRVGSVTAGGANGALEHLNIEQIERIEVLRGSRSAMYGSDAIGGVIQIFTRRSAGEGLHGRVRVAAGSKGVWERSAGISGGNQATRFNLSASLDEMNRFDRTTQGDKLSQDNDTYRNKAVSFSLSHAFSEQLRAGVTALQQRGKNEYDDTFFSGQQPYAKFTANALSTFVEAQLHEQWNSRLELGYSEDKQDINDKFDSPFGSYDINSYRHSATWLNNIQLNAQHALTVGAEHLKDKVRTDAGTRYAQDSRWNNAVFAQHRFTGDYFGTELGWRHDKNQQFGNESTWNAAVSVPVGQSNGVVLSYAEGFRAPALMDLYYPYSGNPELRAEKSKSYELQWRSQFTETLALEASVYRTNIRNAIALDPFWMPQNIAKARVNGFEAALQHELFGAQGALSLSLVDSRDRQSGHQTPRIAKRTLSYDLDKSLGEFALGATWRAVSSSYNDAANTQAIGGYGTLDLRGRWQATQDVQLDVRLTNIFDKGYTRARYGYSGANPGYREDRATFLVGVTWSPALF